MASVDVPAAFADEDTLIEERWTSGGFQFGADKERVELRFVSDHAGKMLSKDFVVFSGYGVGRTTVDPAGQMFPLAAVQSIATFEDEWLRTNDVGFSASIADFDGGYVLMPETTAIVARLELHALDGSVDFLYAGDAVPFEFQTNRSSYPAPS